MKKTVISLSCLLLIATLGACTGKSSHNRFISTGQAEQHDMQGSTYYEAIHQYSAQYAEDKDNLTALLGLARNLRYAGQPNRALEQLDSAKPQFANDPYFQTELGKAFLAAGQFEKAQAALDRAAQHSKDNWEAYTGLGIAYDFLGRYKDAARAYSVALKICPDSASIVNNAAISTALTGDLRTSRSFISRAADLRPHSKKIQNNKDLISRLALSCPSCRAEEVRSRIGTAITAQDWSYGDLACTTGPGEIIETLSHADFIDLKVEFEFDQATLLPEARTMLDGLGFALTSKQLSAIDFILEGHTDAVGTETYNQQLSERRAAAVKAYLVNMLGLDPERLETVGYGESRLLDNENPEGGVNRRVRVRRNK